MKIGDLVKYNPDMCTDEAVGVVVSVDPPSKRTMRLMSVLWPDGLKEDHYEAWFVKV